MHITDIRKRRQRLSALYLDGEFAVEIDTEILQRSGFQVGSEIRDEQLHALFLESEQHRANEKALYLLQDEVPHGIAVEIMSMKKRPDKDIVDVQATIYCERDSHKGIIIGKQGAMLKRIGSTARYDMQRLLGSPIYLQLWVKVKKDWRDTDTLLRNYGYKMDES